MKSFSFKMPLEFIPTASKKSLFVPLLQKAASKYAHCDRVSKISESCKHLAFLLLIIFPPCPTKCTDCELVLSSLSALLPLVTDIFKPCWK